MTGLSQFGVSAAQIAEAAELIRAGRLVAFPTETVYGLGANALDKAAVERIYAAKGRPHSSPIIVHISDLEMLTAVVAAWPDAAQILAEKFWPGPLTLVLPKTAAVPDLVTAGLQYGWCAHACPSHCIGATYSCWDANCRAQCQSIYGGFAY